MMYGLGEAILVIASCMITSIIVSEIYFYVKKKKK